MDDAASTRTVPEAGGSPALGFFAAPTPFPQPRAGADSL